MLDGMSVSNTICELFINLKIVISAIVRCSRQILYLAVVVNYVFPFSVWFFSGLLVLLMAPITTQVLYYTWQRQVQDIDQI